MNNKIILANSISDVKAILSKKTIRAAVEHWNLCVEQSGPECAGFDVPVDYRRKADLIADLDRMEVQLRATADAVEYSAIDVRVGDIKVCPVSGAQGEITYVRRSGDVVIINAEDQLSQIFNLQESIMIIEVDMTPEQRAITQERHLALYHAKCNMMDPLVVAEMEAYDMDEAMGVLYTEGNGAFNHYVSDCLGHEYDDVLAFMRETVRRQEVADSRTNTAWELRRKWITQSDINACEFEACEMYNAEVNFTHVLRCSPVAARDPIASRMLATLSDLYGSNDANAMIQRIKASL